MANTEVGRTQVNAQAGLLPTTKHRRGRRTARQEAALASGSPFLIEAGSLARLLTSGQRWVLDIGFGTGEAVVAYAEADPETFNLAVDMHTPGIGDLLASLDERGISNVRIVDADVRTVLADMPSGCLAGVRTFFPDPWPKKRHHRRRLINSDFARLLAERVQAGGTWHIATDWPDYAEHIEAAVSVVPEWRGGRASRPAHRPQTRYERRGLVAGRTPIDMVFERTTG